jgi:hypothetical protein
MESERDLREPDNSSAACSVVVGDAPKKKAKTFVIRPTARNGVPNSLGA